MERSVPKQKNSTFSCKISILETERKCQNWVSPTKVEEQVFARTMKNIWANTWNSAFLKKWPVFRFNCSLALCFTRTRSQVTQTDDWFISSEFCYSCNRVFAQNCFQIEVKGLNGVNGNIIQELTPKRGQESGKHSENS